MTAMEEEKHEDFQSLLLHLADGVIDSDKPEAQAQLMMSTNRGDMLLIILRRPTPEELKEFNEHTKN